MLLVVFAIFYLSRSHLRGVFVTASYLRKVTCASWLLKQCQILAVTFSFKVFSRNKAQGG